MQFGRAREPSVRLLWVKAGKLLPVDTGGKIRSYNILRRLADIYRLTLVSYYGGERDAAYEAALLSEFPGAQAICTGAVDSDGLSGVLDYVRRLPDSAPYSVTKYTHPKVRSVVEELLAGGQFDLAICDFLAASRNFPDKLPIPCALFQHNVESSLWERMARTETHPLRKISYTYESARMSRYERRSLARFHHIIAVSDNDREQLLAMDPSCEIAVIPTGVDTKKFPVAPASSATPPRIVFTGSMDWEPNMDAVEYFCGQIWPRILTQCPDAVFQIVGRNPFARVERLASPSVEVTGTVPSVIDYLRDATVVVVPLRIGGGTRLKIYEAMAMGKALVSTSIGAEGLTFQNGRDLMLADDAASFADAILLLLRDAEVRRRFEQAATQLAAQFDWAVVTRQFAQVLEKIAADGGTKSSAAGISRATVSR
jgi:polysaccharide biosynthesis protein PslH